MSASPAAGNLSVFNGEGMELSLIFVVRPPLLRLCGRANQFGFSMALLEIDTIRDEIERDAPPQQGVTLGYAKDGAKPRQFAARA